MNTPIQELRQERAEFVKFKEDSLREINDATVRLDAQLKIFNGYRDLPSWKNSMLYEVNKVDFERRKVARQDELIKERAELESGNITIKGQDGKLLTSEELKMLIHVGEIQLEYLKIDAKVADKEQEIRDKLKDHDADIIEKYNKEVK